MNNSLMIKRIEIRRQLAKNPEALNVLQPVEKVVFMAATHRPISTYNSVDLAKALSEVLTWVAKDIGLRNLETKEIQYLTVRISEILKRYYPELSLRDFRMAFEMCITGELDEYLPKNRDGSPDKNHYQQFNAEYICRILNAYREKRTEVLRKIQPPTTVPLLTDNQQTQLENKAKDKLLNSFAHFLKTGELKISLIEEILFYNLLSEAGLVKPVELTTEEQQALMAKVIEDMTAKGASMGEIHRYKNNEAERQSREFRLARRKAIEETFINLKNEKKRLENYVRYKI